MTSKSLFFRLMKEDLKRRLWAFGLSFLTFFFAMREIMILASETRQIQNSPESLES